MLLVVALGDLVDQMSSTELHIAKRAEVSLFPSDVFLDEALTNHRFPILIVST